MLGFTRISVVAGGEEISKRAFLRAISPVFPFNLTYTPLPSSKHAVNDVHDAL